MDNLPDNVRERVVEPRVYELVETFGLWEEEYRKNPDGFMTAIQTAHAEVTRLSELRALYFLELLDKVMK